MTADIRIEPPNGADMGAVITQLVAYNASKTNGEVQDCLFIAARDAAGAIQGGLVGARVGGTRCALTKMLS